MESRDELHIGDRLTAIKLPGSSRIGVGRAGVRSITLRQFTGPMAYWLAAQVQFDDDRADMIIPLHMAESFEIQYGD